MANYGRSVYCGKNTFSLFALSYSLSKVVSQQPENVLFGAYGFSPYAFFCYFSLLFKKAFTIKNKYAIMIVPNKT